LKHWSDTPQKKKSIPRDTKQDMIGRYKGSVFTFIYYALCCKVVRLILVVMVGGWLMSMQEDGCNNF